MVEAVSMGKHRKSKKRKRPPKDMTIDLKDVKIRKRIAPGCRVILSATEKEQKHKKKFLETICKEDEE